MASKANILIAWPDSKLSPNYGDRNRFMKYRLRAEAREAAMEDCRWTVDDGWQPFDGQGEMTVIFHPRDRRRRDLDNLFAMIKHAVDGVCEVLGIDDAQLHPVTLDFGEPSPERPYIEVLITDTEEPDTFYGVTRPRTTGGPAGRPKKVSDDELRAKVSEALAAAPDASSNVICRAVGGNRNRVLGMIRKLRPR